MTRQYPQTIMHLNWSGETIDSLDSLDYPTRGDFLREMNRLRQEYALAGMSGAWSKREIA